MRRLIQSEFKKIFKSKVNIVLLLILFIFNGYRTYQVYHQPLQYRTDIVMKDENGIERTGLAYWRLADQIQHPMREHSVKRPYSRWIKTSAPL